MLKLLMKVYVGAFITLIHGSDFSFMEGKEDVIVDGIECGIFHVRGDAGTEGLSFFIRLYDGEWDEDSDGEEVGIITGLHDDTHEYIARLLYGW